MNQQPNEESETVKGARHATRRTRPKPTPCDTGAPVVLVLSHDPSVRLLVASNCHSPWSVETRESLDPMWEPARDRSVGLVVLDDELLPAEEREWYLSQVQRLAHEAPMLYVASKHSAVVEKNARCHGAVYYTSKPLEAVSLGQVLQTWLRHLRDRDGRVAVRGQPKGEDGRLEPCDDSGPGIQGSVRTRTPLA